MGTKSVLAIGVLALSLVCCAKSGDSASADTPKGLWSNWTKSDNSFSFDVTGGQLGVPQSFYFLFSNGAICACTLTITGAETSGNYTLASCAYISGGSGNPGCSALNETGTFTKPSSTLSLCTTGGSCRDYR